LGEIADIVKNASKGISTNREKGPEGKKENISKGGGGGEGGLEKRPKLGLEKSTHIPTIEIKE